MRVLKVQE
jgi:hypothetical protein